VLPKHTTLFCTIFDGVLLSSEIRLLSEILALFDYCALPLNYRSSPHSSPHRNARCSQIHNQPCRLPCGQENLLVSDARRHDPFCFLHRHSSRKDAETCEVPLFAFLPLTNCDSVPTRSGDAADNDDVLPLPARRLALQNGPCRRSRLGRKKQ
jgi:hypothetical protein